MKPDSSNICTNILYVKKEKEKKKKEDITTFFE